MRLLLLVISDRACSGTTLYNNFLAPIHHVTFFVHLKRSRLEKAHDLNSFVSRQSNLILSNLSLENNKTFLLDRVHALQGICF